MVTQTEIARRVGLDVSAVNRILNRRREGTFRKATIRKVFKAARELGYDFNRLKYNHRRGQPRKKVSIRADLCVYRSDGSLYDRGRARARDLSLSGVRLSDVAFTSGGLPEPPFSMGIRLLCEPMKDIWLVGRLVRLGYNGTVDYGIEFSGLSPGVESKLRQVTQSRGS